MAIISYPQVVLTSHSNLAGGSSAQGDAITPERYNCKVQAMVAGTQTFQAWIEVRYDDTNWMVVWTSASSAAGSGAAQANTVTSPSITVPPERPVRVCIRNTAGSAGDFVSALTAWER